MMVSTYCQSLQFIWFCVVVCNPVVVIVVQEWVCRRAKGIGHFQKYHNTLCLSLQNLLLIMVPRENKSNTCADCGGTNKEYYGIF